MPAVGDYTIVAILILGVMAVAALIMLLTHVIGPKRAGAVKNSPYESGVDPIGDARQRFNVRFYLVAVLFLIFDVEIVFLYPWAVLFPKLRAGVMEYNAAQEAGNLTGISDLAIWAGPLADAGFTPAFFSIGIGVFFLLLTVGFFYEWRKGVFKWD